MEYWPSEYRNSATTHSHTEGGQGSTTRTPVFLPGGRGKLDASASATTASGQQADALVGRGPAEVGGDEVAGEPGAGKPATLKQPSVITSSEARCSAA